MLACEICRKRKVRCSGTTPCTNCERNEAVCHFNYNRRRRGPRPKRRPNPPSHASGSASISSTAPDAENPGPASEQSSVVTPISIIDTDPWKKCLEDALGDKPYTVGDTKIHVSQVSHLVHIFFTSVNNVQQLPVLTLTTFVSRVQKSHIPRALCHAICSVAIRFSRHGSLQSSTLEDDFMKDARRVVSESQTHMDRPRRHSCHDQLDQLLTLCLLSMAEAYRGNGFQAWYDITTALKLATSLKCRADGALDPNLASSLNLACRYLEFAELLHITDQAMQIPSFAVTTTNFIDETCLAGTPMSDYPDLQNKAPLFASLLALWKRVSLFSQQDITDMAPAPWGQASEFLSLKQDIDSLSMWHSGQLLFYSERLQQHTANDGNVGEYLLSLAILHGSIILLNRPFLPIGVVSRAQKPRHRRRSSDEEGKDAKVDVDFPAAPRFFLRERALGCIRSARAVTLICESILSQGLILPPFFGYVLFLAGQVFLNQLHTKNNPITLAQHVSDLKTIFMALGSMRSFYAPARIWVEYLFSAHSQGPLLERDLISPVDMFSRFSARLGKLKEPSYCPLGQHLAFAPEDSSAFRSPPSQRSLSSQESQSDAGVCGRNTSEVIDPDSSGDEPAWYQEYSHKMTLAMEATDRAVRVDEGVMIDEGSLPQWVLPDEMFYLDSQAMLQENSTELLELLSAVHDSFSLDNYD